MFDIKEKIDKAVNSNIILKSVISRNGELQNIIKYLPEIIEILFNDERGLEILKETKIYDYITK